MKLYRLFYLIFVASIIFGGSIYFGPATMRQYMSVVMFSMSVPHLGIIWKYSNRLTVLFFVFLFCYMISAIHEDCLVDFLRDFIAYYMVGMVAFFSTIIYLKKGGSLYYIVTVFLICGILNGIVTYLQSIQNPIGLAVGYLFGDMDNVRTTYKFLHMEDGSSLVMWGMMGDAVFNGYLSMLMPLLTLELFSSKLLANHTMFRNFLLTFLILFYIYTLFLVQERGPFILVCLLLLFHSVFIPKYRKYSVPLIFVLLVFGSALMNMDVIKESRFGDGEEDPRAEIFSKTFDFILDNLLLGGKTMAYNYVGKMPHNFILNSYIYAGIIGGSAICGVVFYQLIKSWQLYKKRICIGIVLAFVGYTLNGLLHNPALVTGDVILWILWGVICYELSVLNRGSELVHHRLYVK